MSHSLDDLHRSWVTKGLTHEIIDKIISDVANYASDAYRDGYVHGYEAGLNKKPVVALPKRSLTPEVIIMKPDELQEIIEQVSRRIFHEEEEKLRP